MAKGQVRSTKEKRKLKQDKKAKAAPGGAAPAKSGPTWQPGSDKKKGG